MGTLTVKQVQGLEPGETATDKAPRGAGRLQVRRLAGGGLSWYYRYTAPDGERVRLVLGSGLTLAQARTAADTMSRRYQSGARDLREALAADLAERESAAESARRDAEALACRGTLGSLLIAYVAQLRRDGKISAHNVESTLQRHVHKPWPKVCDMAAADVTADDLLPVLARIVDAGIPREAAKVRSYIKAAYSAAIRSRQDARGLQALRALKLQTNPARDLATITGSTSARERALSLAELRAYWVRINALPVTDGALLRFHLLTGGQRIEQLGRATLADLDMDAQTLRLRDPKGRRQVARIHDVPLLPGALEAIALLRGGLSGPYVFTVTGGKSGATYHVLDSRVQPVAAAMLEADELPGGPFTIGDLRRTVETRLAAAGVSLDIRAQLQSHGLGGVQARHYDRHSYLDEKRSALETLLRLVTGKPSDVVQMRRKVAQ